MREKSLFAKKTREDVYNQKRLHASLDCISPNEFELNPQGGGYQDMDSHRKIGSGEI
jgi:hypothetical protein